MAGIGQVPHLTEGGCHGHYNRPYPQAVVQGTTPQPVPCISTPTGSKSSRVSAPARSDPSTTAQAGSDLLDPLEPAFTHPTYHRFVFLALAAILTLGGRTIANLLRCLGAVGPRTPQQLSPRLLPRRWSSWTSGTPIRPVVLARFVPQGPIELAGDDTVTEHPGPRRLRQGLPSRPGPLHSFLHCLPLGAQVGRLDRARPLPVLPLGDGLCPC